MSVRRRLPVVMVAGVLFAGSAAQALINLQFPVTSIYREARAVRSGSIVAVDVGARLVDVKPGETFKGGAAPALLRLQIVAPADLISRVAVGQPVIIFGGEVDGKGAALLHVADTWLLAQGNAEASVPTWRIVQVYEAAKAYPGRTAGLVRLVAAMKAGGSPIESKIDPACFGGKVREVANLGVKATFMEAADLNGDGRSDLLVGTGEGVRLFLGKATGYTDATGEWGLQGVVAQHAAVGDVNGDGRLDLLLGGSLWVQQGGKFVRQAVALDLPPEAEWMAVALAEVTGDKQADAVVLLRTGALVVIPGVGGSKPGARVTRKLWEGAVATEARFSPDWGEADRLNVMVVSGGSVTRYELTADGAGATSFAQLTGSSLVPGLGLDNPTSGAVKAVSVDCDGNGKCDFLLLAPGGGLALLNRGFGAFYVDNTIPAKLRPADAKSLPFAVTPGTCMAAIPGPDETRDRQVLLVLTEEGLLFEMQNPDP